MFQERLELTWLQKEVKSRWEKQVKKKKGERERELENSWMSTKCTAPTSSTEPMFNNHFLYRENYYFLPCIPSHWDFCLREGAEFMNNEFILVMQAEMRESSIPVTIRDLNSCLNSKVAKLSSFQKLDVAIKDPNFNPPHEILMQNTPVVVQIVI